MTQGETLYTEGRLGEAWDALMKEAKAGDGRAMYCLGQYHLFGLSEARENPLEAAAWFRRGAEKDALSALMAALFLRKEELDRAALAEALARAETEAAEGSVNALYAAAAVLWSGAGEAIPADEEKARDLCGRAVELGFWQAEMEMGLHHLNGTHAEKDEVKGAALLKRAADKGVGKAEYHLAFCFLEGIGVEKNAARAVSYYQKALRHGYVKAAVELGVYYETGTYVHQDRKKAYQLYKKAADWGDAEGKAHLGDMLLAGEAVKRNVRQGTAFLSEAARSGSAYAVLRLGELAFSSGDEKGAFPYFLEGARMGLPAAQYLTGVCLLGGRGTAADREAARGWLRRAAQGGSREAAALLVQAGL